MRPFAASTRPTAALESKQFADDVAYYLRLDPKQLPSRYFYDALGSALFEAICELPWYSITRAERRLLEVRADDIVRRLPGLSTVVELGPGSGEKLSFIVRAAGPSAALTVHLVDVSEAALDLATRTLSVHDGVVVVPHQASYEEGLETLSHDLVNPPRGATKGRTLVLFLGSNIGNFDRPGADEFLRTIRRALAPGDALLVGADLVKAEQDLLLAYDDPLGVTAAFNRNLLVRVNRELGADFDVAAFEHRAIWNAIESRVEMHLVGTRPQQVHIEASRLDLTFNTGEAIWTESSYKYRAPEIVATLRRAGFRQVDQWLDELDGFALTLVEAA
jgi:dimethylhistidine N-methyltransferase